jgi:PiT family inorganic phosphate transporter
MFNFAPHKEKFFDLFKEAAENALAGAKALHGFAAETGAALTIELATRLGIPLSTTHTINTAIIGAGATRRFSAVRWGVTLEIVSAWILTFPICGAIGWLATKIFLLFA